MIPESISSLYSNIRQKTTNPFLGTFIIVWSISNWKLLYTFFTFDENTNLENRINIVEKYIYEHQMLKDLFICITESIVVLITTYILLNLSRFIINIFENKLTPWVYKITKSNSIVRVEIYNSALDARDNFSSLYEKERAQRVKIQGEIDSITKKYSDDRIKYEEDNQNLKNKVSNLTLQNDNLGNDYNTQQVKLETLITDFNQLEKEYNELLEKRLNDLNKENIELSNKYQELTLENETLRMKYDNKLKKLLIETLHLFPIPLKELFENETIHLLDSKEFTKYCLENGLLKRTSAKLDSAKRNTYLLTPLGENLKEIFHEYKKNISSKGISF